MDETGPVEQEDWERVLAFLRGALIFPRELTGLMVHLTSGDRQGGPASQQKLALMAQAVQLFDALAKQRGLAAAKADADEMGVPFDTIRKWRKKVTAARGEPRLAQLLRPGNSLMLKAEAPDLLHLLKLTHRSALREEPRKNARVA
jgi:hypothetical protein